MKATDQQIRRAAKGKVDASNMAAVLVALDRYGERFGLDRPHRLAHFLAQVMHESGDFRYDREVWGPTPAQKRYDTRTDLGNTPAIDGDGFLFRGRAGIQVTGTSNYRQFTAWCRKEIGGAVPDFVANPDAVLMDPWEGLAPIWYWATRNLNRLADQGDIETITVRINGGKNGFDDRVDRYARCALVLLGMAPDAIKQFQASKGLGVDGDPGPKTRAALHKALVALTPGESRKAGVTSAPVIEDKPVVPVSVDKEIRDKTSLLSGATGLGGAGMTLMGWLNGVDTEKLLWVGAFAAAGVIIFLIAGEWIIRRVKSIRAVAEG